MTPHWPAAFPKAICAVAAEQRGKQPAVSEPKFPAATVKLQPVVTGPESWPTIGPLSWPGPASGNTIGPLSRTRGLLLQATKPSATIANATFFI
jgi:hypothetical protein